METVFVSLAGYIIKINSNNNLKNRFNKYLTEKKEVDFCVTANRQHFRVAKGFMPGEPEEEIEFAAILCAIHEELLKRGAATIHAAAVEVDGRAYAFSGESGVGKSTQVALLKQLLKGRLAVINGDKPIITFEGEKAYVSGSPWCGKEGESENKTVPLCSFCFLERAEAPEIRKLSDGEVIERLFRQFSVPADKELMQSALSIADKLIKSTDFYLLKCTNDIKCAELAFKEMSK